MTNNRLSQPLKSWPLVKTSLARLKRFWQIQVSSAKAMFSEGNVFAVDTYGVIPYIAEKRVAHNKPLMERFKPDDAMPEGDDVTALELMRWRLQTKEGRAIYALRKSTIEPTFGIQKEVMGYRQFLVRGFAAVTAEWDLLCTGFNLKKMFIMAMANISNGLILVQILAAYRTFWALFCYLRESMTMVRTAYTEV